MKLLRVGEVGSEKPALIDNENKYRDLSPIIKDLDPSTLNFESLEKIVVYPVQDENKWIDGEGKILPDALLVDKKTTAKGLAYAVHTDLGDGFIKAVDCKSSRIIGSEHELNDGDVIKIHSKS